MNTAPLPQRILAHLIDLVLLSFFLFPVKFLFKIDAVFGDFGGLFFLKPSSMFYYGIILAYFLLMEGKAGYTAGKYILDLKVTDISGNKATMNQVLIRNIMRVIDFLPFLYIVGLISIAVNKDRQRIGDIVAKTIVVKENK